MKLGNILSVINANSHNLKVRLIHVLTLLLGLMLGLTAAYYFNFIQFDFSQELAQAKAMGIESRSILKDYPKTKDLVTYVTVLCFPVFGALVFWLLIAKHFYGKELANILNNTHPALKSRNKSWTICLVLVSILLLYLAFDINNFYRSRYNMFVGDWIFLSEEGAMLGWIQTLLSGGVYGKDLFSSYGPMMFYPLYAAMKILGVKVMVLRIYAFCMNLLAYGIVIAFLFKTVRSRALFVICSITYIAVFSPHLLLSPHISYLRVVLGILPLFLVYLYHERPNKTLLLIAGVITGTVLLFSQEVGVCATFALVVQLSLGEHEGSRFKSTFFEFTWVMAGIFLGIIPMFAYLAYHGALGAALETMYSYPRLAMLGFVSIPFPEFREFINHPLSRKLFLNYWIIFCSILGTLYVAPQIILRKYDKRTALISALLVFSVILFRVALGRSGEERAFFILAPSLLMLFLFIDNALIELLYSRAMEKKISNLLFLGLLITFMGLAFNYTSTLPVNVQKVMRLALNPAQKFTVVRNGRRLPELVRGGDIYYSPALSDTIIKLKGFIDKNVASDDYMYFFPNEAAYYFLFDKKVPTRYVMSYFAITYDYERDFIKDMEKNRTKYIFYSKSTWRLDDIDERVLTPLIYKYITANYKPYVDLGQILVLIRNGN